VGQVRTAGDLPQKCLRSQEAVVEQAIETAALMLGSDKSRGYPSDGPGFAFRARFL